MRALLSDYETLRERAAAYGQEHVFRFWDHLTEPQRRELLQDVREVDFDLMQRLIQRWIISPPPPVRFTRIEPVPVLPPYDPSDPTAKELYTRGEQEIREGRVAVLTVAGGQGTRLGYEKPKGTFPIGPVSGKSLFHYHAEKILALQRRYTVQIPWILMLSHATAAETKRFFGEHAYLGLEPSQVFFMEQEMVPSVDARGRFLLEKPYRLAKNPNGHGGCLPALVRSGALSWAQDRGIQYLSYFQVDNWAARVIDPYFVGAHCAAHAQMSSQIMRKTHPREPVGVHCVCDGKYHVIEYTELDLYPQLLETDAQGNLIHFAGNPAIHILSCEFVSAIHGLYKKFPWHCSHKKVPYVDEQGHDIKPKEPNAFKFETFIFDALQFIEHAPVCVEIKRGEEYTPIKSSTGENSVESARAAMNQMWASWLEAAGIRVSKTPSGQPSFNIEISPLYALDLQEFLSKASGAGWTVNRDIYITPDGALLPSTSSER
jgi:UDP-N-acetylglucosamine/UDP-N-acetylgalactosamine diphosphorylase